MQGADLRKLIEIFDRNPEFGCLVEALVDHEMSPGDPLTPIIKCGAQGVGYYFWFMGGDWWRPSISVKWDGRYSGEGCNYTELYKRKNKVRKPITEIKFVHETKSDLILPEKNPLIVFPKPEFIEKYFSRIKSV